MFLFVMEKTVSLTAFCIENIVVFFFFMHNNEMRGGSLRTERQNMDFPAVLRTV